MKVIQLIKTKSVLYLSLFSLSAKLAAFPFYFYSLFEKKLILKIYKITDSQNLQKFHSNTLKPIWNHEDTVNFPNKTYPSHSFIHLTNIESLVCATPHALYELAHQVLLFFEHYSDLFLAHSRCSANSYWVKESSVNLCWRYS